MLTISILIDNFHNSFYNKKGNKREGVALEWLQVFEYFFVKVH